VYAGYFYYAFVWWLMPLSSPLAWTGRPEAYPIFEALGVRLVSSLGGPRVPKQAHHIDMIHLGVMLWSSLVSVTL